MEDDLQTILIMVVYITYNNLMGGYLKSGDEFIEKNPSNRK
jgi:hypothetical protein